ncbi:unnamed protein product [Meganyctiphanes norvegica]|uniref:Uncharacterized protein n=1 Tax=Meganyctiphanes norvegica TaxID=48144 RepID=A0AAV2PSC0_MEGNR
MAHGHRNRQQAFVNLQINLFQMEQELQHEFGGPPVAPTIFKCPCTETCDCYICEQDPLPTDGSINVRTLNWCPTADQAQFINCFVGLYGSYFYYTWPCGLSAQCNISAAPFPKDTVFARNFMEMMLL